MASHCGFVGCRMPAGHGGDFHVGDPEPGGDGTRRIMWPKAESRLRVLATLGPGPYVGVLAGSKGEDEDAVYRRRAGLDDVMRELEQE